MYNISNLFHFGTTLHTASKQPQKLYGIYLMLYVQSETPDDGRRDRLKNVECCSKINLRYCACDWFCCRNL